jgi:hypothetical protein
MMPTYVYCLFLPVSGAEHVKCRDMLNYLWKLIFRGKKYCMYKFLFEKNLAKKNKETYSKSDL